MVTTNSGSARLTMACQVNTGTVNTGQVSENCTADPLISPRAATKAMATSSVSGTA
ncbi:hypothetical protein FQZ97_496390 [compost metagenome]